MTFRALLIGNWEYGPDLGGMPKLKGPRRDLEEIKSALTHPEFGLFVTPNVEVKPNLSATELSDALYDVTQDCLPDDVLLVYYSGHGERLGADQRLGLIGIDVPYGKRHARAFDTKVLAERLGETRARSKVLILDCCYSGAFRGDFVDDEVLHAFGQGTVVLASGGNQVVSDEGSADGPSAFTAALAHVLTDGALPGRQGYLTADEIYAALNRFQPRLPQDPHRQFNGQGQIHLARRPVVPQPADAPPRALPRWAEELKVLPVSVTFSGQFVTAAWDRNGDGTITSDERDVTALDQTRLAVVRRLCQMADAVMRAKDYSEPRWQRRARRALEAAGVNLFDTALPPAVQKLLRDADDDDKLLVRLDLSFEPPWSVLAEYPWEYLHVPRIPPVDTSSQGQKHILVSRAGRSCDRPPSTSDKIDVAVVSSLSPPYQRLADRVGLELVVMSSVRTLSEPTDYPASYAQLMDAVDAEPEYLVVCAPLQRTSSDAGASARVGFGGQQELDWHDVSGLAADLASASRLRAIIMVSVAAGSSQDAIRAAPTAAAALNARLGLPVVFVCHTPGLERYLRPEASEEPKTFVGLLIEALSTGRSLDFSVWFARYQLLRYIPVDLQPTFGIPGFVDRKVSIERRPSGSAAARVPGRAVGLAEPKE